MPLAPRNSSAGEMGVWGEVMEKKRKLGRSLAAAASIALTQRPAKAGSTASRLQPGVIGPAETPLAGSACMRSLGVPSARSFSIQT